MKICTKCKKEQPIINFYKNLHFKDKLDIYCRSCHKLKNREKQMLHREGHKQRYKKYYSTHRELMLKKKKEWYSNNKYKKRAHALVSKAIKNGQLKRLSCEQCGREKTYGHHDDYSKPLEVRWLCQSCHMLLHQSGALRD